MCRSGPINRCNGSETNATSPASRVAMVWRERYGGGTQGHEEVAMPGGRLTQQERQQISQGLADDLAYAEIARRLDRPTSTITREVLRNGGPTAYRAELTHRATERRTHRRRPAAPRAPEAPPLAYGRDAEAVRDYEELFTTAMMASGLPK